MSILSLFVRPTIETEARTRLEKAKRDLMAAHDHVEFATSQVAYHTATIERLEAQLKTSETKVSDNSLNV